jgi:futalosine hydrolase
MMQILLIAATRYEIEPFVLVNNRIEILITGVGIPATMYHLQKRLQQNTPALVIQAGIAGSFHDGISLGQVVLVQRDAFADIGMEEKEKFTPIFQSGFADKNTFPFTDGWLINSNTILNQSLLTAVNAITINKVSDRLLQKQQTIANFSPDIESMEGAALHYVCLQQNVPFMQIRSISNTVGERDKSNWKLKEAVTNLNKELGKIIEAVEG